MIKCHIGKISVGLALVTGIIATLTTQAGFCEYPVALPFLLPAFFFGLLFCCQPGGVFFPGNVNRVSSTSQPLTCRGYHPVRTRRTTTMYFGPMNGYRYAVKTYARLT